MNNLPLGLRFIEGRNLYMRPVPLEELWHSRSVSGHLDFNTYKEEYSLFQVWPRYCLGLTVNGIFYAMSENEVNQISAAYDRINRFLTFYNFPIYEEDDKACVLVAEHFSLRDPVRTMVVEVRGLANIKETEDDRERYYVPELQVYEFVGLSVNGLLYCHPDDVEFDSETQELIVKNLELEREDKIHVVYNVKEKDRRRKLLDVRKSYRLFPILEYLIEKDMFLYIDGEKAGEMTLVKVTEGDSRQGEVFVTENGEPVWRVSHTELYQDTEDEHIYLKKEGEKLKQVEYFDKGQAPREKYRWL